MQSKQSKPYYHKIILDLLVQLTTNGKYRSLRAFKQSGDKLTAEQKETLKSYTDSIILLLEIGMTFHEIKQFLVNLKARLG
ncbi:Phage related anti-repressor protein [Lactococcus lactis subsp. lactis]|uniref:Phage related anti-repressor protein n=2 Tax=Lactococcus lactis TaxID=1358 RepID=A0A0V8E4W9_LACLL|nr:Phage related anti-repressor protein [Lactococcus lactis subsp. lactis]